MKNKEELEEKEKQEKEEFKQFLKSDKALFVPTQITNDPFQKFYKDGLKSIIPILELFFEEFTKENQDLYDDIVKAFSKISQLKQEIKDYKKTNKIIFKKFKLFLIILLCFVIIGFFLLSKFKQYWKDISDFNNIHKEKEAQIQQLEDHIQKSNRRLFSYINYKDITNFVFKKWGFTLSDQAYKSVFYDFNPKRYNIFLQEGFHLKPDIVALDKNISFFYKSTPFVDGDLISRFFRLITTSKSESYPYTVVVRRKVNGQWVKEIETRYETLTAIHNENTPFLTSTSVLLSKTNFHPNISFHLKLNEKGSSNKKIKFENSEFQKKIRLDFHDENIRKISSDYDENEEKSSNYSYENEMSASILEFFTIKTQEDIVALKKSDNLNQLYKIENTLLINREFNSEVEFYKEIDSINVLKEVNLTIEPKKNFDTIQKMSHIYFASLIKAMSTIMIFPVFNRESYLTKHNYRISQQEHENDQLIKDDWQTLAWTYWKYFSFLKGGNTTKTWLTFDHHLIIDNNGSKNMFAIYATLHSYYSKSLLDDVLVCGRHTGCHHILVPFERYYEMNETKWIFIVNKKEAKSLDNQTNSQQNSNSWQNNWTQFSFVPYQLRTFLKYIQMFSLENKSEKIKELESLLNNKNIYSIVEENRTIILVNDTSINEKKILKVVQLTDEIMND
ncbi:hypothetical protein [Mesomycoplasma hyorhinis]|uniref:hypothetical protein n=1 Tax=Mesomycoplasma hyorhinis TaxID=2100 RepID=UPI001C056C84|nr:hypothetical protein [Mesomycoplasma hyorhinis]